MSAPDFDTIQAEAAAIEQLSRPVDDLAAQILALTPTTPAEVDAYVRAEAWEAGRYAATYLRWAA